jgi:hypothetical protein
MLLGTMHPVEATFQMQLSDGSTTKTISKNESDGRITFIGSVGDFAFDVTLGYSKPHTGSPTNPELEIHSFNVTSSNEGGNLTVTLSDEGFGPVGPPTLFSTELDLRQKVGSVSLSAQTFFANENNPFIQVGNVGALTTGDSHDSSTAQRNDVGTPFSMKMVVTVTHTGAGASIFDATLKATSVPEPSATLCLGIALFGIGGYVEWQRRKITI